MKNLRISLNRSLIGRKPDHVATAEVLGLRKIGKQVIKPDNPAIRGMIRKISYLVSVEEVSDAT